MTILKKLEDMKNSLETLAQERSKLEGKREGLMDQLAAMGFKSVEEAQTEIARIREAKSEAEAEAEKLLETFQETYKEYL